MSGAPSPDCPSACARARRPTGSGRCSSAIIGWGPSTCGIPSWPNTPCAPSTNLKLIPTFLPPPKRSHSVTHVSEHLLPLSPVQTALNALVLSLSKRIGAMRSTSDGGPSGPALPSSRRQVRGHPRELLQRGLGHVSFLINADVERHAAADAQAVADEGEQVGVGISWRIQRVSGGCVEASRAVDRQQPVPLAVGARDETAGRQNVGDGAFLRIARDDLVAVQLPDLAGKIVLQRRNGFFEAAAVGAVVEGEGRVGIAGARGIAPQLPVAQGVAEGLPVVTTVIPPAGVQLAEAQRVFADERGVAALVFRLVGGVPREGGGELRHPFAFGRQVGDEALAEPVDALGELEDEIAPRAVTGTSELVEDGVGAGIEIGVLADGEDQPVGAGGGELREEAVNVENPPPPGGAGGGGAAVLLGRAGGRGV